MTALTAEVLAAMEARAKDATDGPWEADHEFGHVHARGERRFLVCSLDSEYVRDTFGGDAAFIAHARDDVPRLLADHAHQREEIARLTAALDGTGAFAQDFAAYREACAVSQAAWAQLPTPVSSATPEQLGALGAADNARDRSERAVERSACAALTALAGGADAGEWLRGRLDYDGTGP